MFSIIRAISKLSSTELSTLKSLLQRANQHGSLQQQVVQLQPEVSWIQYYSQVEVHRIEDVHGCRPIMWHDCPVCVTWLPDCVVWLVKGTPELSTSNFLYYNRCFHVLHPQVPQGTFVSSVRRKSARALPPGGGRATKYIYVIHIMIYIFIYCYTVCIYKPNYRYWLLHFKCTYV